MHKIYIYNDFLDNVKKVTFFVILNDFDNLKSFTIINKESFNLFF